VGLVTGETAPAPSLDVLKVRQDFPILVRKVHGKPLVYLDNAATAQKPRAVLNALEAFHAEYNANVHRAVHELSARATREYEAAREKLQRFIGAADRREVLFVRGTTEGINLVAQAWGRVRVGAGDRVLVTHMEHHSNIVPWQMLCKEKGASLDVVPVTDAGELDLGALERLLTPRTRLLAVAHVSNALGTVNPVKEIVALARAKGVAVLVDGAQAAPHLKIDVKDLDADFYAFSGHKLYGPTGIGVLYGKASLLEEMPPWQGGGDMIERVSFEGTTYNELPYKFEAGTPHIAGAVGLGAAADYLTGLGLEKVAAHEQGLLAYATERLGKLPGLRILGTAPHKAAVISFTLEGAHPQDVASILDQQGVAVRAGHHCAMPLMERFGVTATARASFALYNTVREVDVFVQGLIKARDLLK
jgi:cysteine desulfurase / selenocysteine lyase